MLPIAIRPKPLMSVIVVFFNMRREAGRTLYSLSTAYQTEITEADYEVLAVDNGSTEPLDEDAVRRHGRHFRYFRLPPGVPSPAPAINFAARRARGRFLGIFIDGARILSPGLLQHVGAAVRAFSEPVVATLGWHLGPELQNLSITKGYDQGVEDELLERSDWQHNGYNLFDVSVLAASSRGGFFGPLAESNGLFLTRRLFAALGGYDEAFDLAGGGLANLDFYKRVVEASPTSLVVLLGEGTFHQLHGGVMSNVPKAEQREQWARFEDQYRRVRGSGYAVPEVAATYLGSMPPQARRFVLPGGPDPRREGG